MDPDTTTTQPTDDQNGGTIIVELESMIKSNLSGIDKLEGELSKHKDMLEDFFNNDATYKDHAEKAKEANRIKSKTKQEIMKQPAVADLANKVKNMKQELKEMQNALSDYLREYQRLSGVNEIEGEDGEIREIVYTAKLIRKSFSLN